MSLIANLMFRFRVSVTIRITEKRMRSSHPEINAYILLHLASLRFMFATQNGQELDMFDNPYKLNRDLAKDLFCMLEEYRHTSNQTVDMLSEMLDRNKQLKPALYHTVAFISALDVLASTVGLNLINGKRKSVASIYTELQSGYPHINSVYESFRKVLNDQIIASPAYDFNICLSGFTAEDLYLFSKWKPDIFHEISF